VHGRQRDPVAALKCRSPEQTRNATAAPTPSSDIYALGVILYEMLTGHPPFEGTTPVDTALLIQSQPPVAPRRFRPWLPPDLEAICLTCLHKKPERRFQSAEKLADELTRYLHDQRIKTGAYGWLGRALRILPRSR
jgi:serine/threonine protein kinase